MNLLTWKHQGNFVIRLAGDSGDGIQLIGKQLATLMAKQGSSVSTIADFPAEIRAPKGTLGGVSGFQLCVSETSVVLTSGDQIDLMVALNPASLQKPLKKLKPSALIIIDSDTFTDKNFAKSNFTPETIDQWPHTQIIKLPLTSLCRSALEGLSLAKKDIDRSRNTFLLGFLVYILALSKNHASQWISSKFLNTDIRYRNTLAFEAGWSYAQHHYNLEETPNDFQEMSLGKTAVRYVTGNQATALGLLAAGVRSQRGLFFASYPITPASDIYHELAKFRHLPLVTHQAEDEIAAIGSALGASYGGRLGATASSGPGMSLKSEFLGLAVMAELPLVVVNVQRAGPSTGMPTKTAQGDLMQALFGRHGDAPLVVVAASSSRDCFTKAFWAAKIAIKYMSPVIVLSDSYLANSSEVWEIPDIAALDSIPVCQEPDLSQPYSRNAKTGARPWITPGIAGGEHTIGGLEKQPQTGQVSYLSDDHQRMTQERRQKIANVAQEYPPTPIFGSNRGKMLLITWGSNFGVGRESVQELQSSGQFLSHIHLEYICPLPQDLKDIVQNFEHILVAESNDGQLVDWLAMNIDRSFISIIQNTGMPFTTREMTALILRKMEEL